jgi:hypothetical protein
MNTAFRRAESKGLRAGLPAISPLLLALTVGLVAPSARAEVTKVDVTTRTDIGSGYELVVGRLHFAVDPKNPRNAVIVDLDKAPKNANGRVEFVADFSLQRPTSGGSGAALIDVVNRGGATALRLNRSTRPGDAADDGLLGRWA